MNSGSMAGMNSMSDAAKHSTWVGNGNIWFTIILISIVAVISTIVVVLTIRKKQKPSQINLLDIPVVNRIIKSKFYPGIFQVLTAIVFAFIVYELLFGPSEAHENVGTALTWVLWWPLIPLLFFMLGRFWCAICPFATLNDLVQKFIGSKKPVPQFLKKYGIWIIDAIFILITWSDHTIGIVENPRGSGTLLLMMVLGVTISGALFERRTWCRYLCFLGGLSGNYSRAGSLELRATPSKCSECKVQSCYKGGDKAPGCPMYEFPRTMDTNAQCNLCGYCVKNCPNESIRISPRIPTSELWGIRNPKFEGAFLATVIMGIVFVQNITMLKAWKPILTNIEAFFGTTNYFITFTIVFLTLMLVPIGALYLTSYFSGRSSGMDTQKTFTVLGYSLIPLDLAGHLAHNLFHLLAEGKSIYYTALGLFKPFSHGSTAFVSDQVIQGLQYLLVLLGVIGSLYTAYKMLKIRQSKEGTLVASVFPIALLIVLLGALNLILFYLPMEMRM